MDNSTKSLSTIQSEVKEWSYHNFGEGGPGWRQILGMQEELGELSHHYLKRAQKIRNNEDHDEGIEDSLGDFMIYAMDFCNKEYLSLEEIINRVCEKVKQRDWIKNPTNGETNENPVSS